MEIHRVVRLVALVFFVAPLTGLASDYPIRPIRFIVPYAAGGGTDTYGRMIALKLTEAWGQQVVVDNRGGGGSIIGTEIVAKSAADGYTLLLAANPFTTNAALKDKLPYDTLRDFAPVTMIASAPVFLVVHPSLPVNSVNELIAYAKANPGKLSYATSGNGGPQHLAGELFKTRAGIDMVHIPYKGSAPATSDLVAGQVKAGFSSIQVVLPFVKSGRLRALAVTGLQRTAIAPDVPTVAESGLPGYQLMTWYGIFVPAGTPRPIVGALNAEITRIIKLPEIRDRIFSGGAEVVGNDSAAFAKFLREEVDSVRKLAKTANIRLD